MLDGLESVRVALEGDPTLLPRRQRRTIIKALRAARVDGIDQQLDIPESLRVRAAPGALEMFLTNLLRNVERHARRSAVMVRARMLPEGEHPWPASSKLRPSSPMVLLTIADEGPGVPASMLATLFTPGAKGHRGGDGLGLWIARELARIHGGELWLEPSPRGATFCAVWPGVVTPVGEWPTDPVQFGRAVRAVRDKAGLTREQLASLSGVPDSTIRNVETARHCCTTRVRTTLVNILSSLL
jgi:signal transduction histidine kinase